VTPDLEQATAPASEALGERFVLDGSAHDG
jgi:hypothetical protein